MTGAASLTRERVLRATVASLAAGGYAGTTARSIAALGGFAPGVIYYHFADLDELFVATVQFTSAGVTGHSRMPPTTAATGTAASASNQARSDGRPRTNDQHHNLIRNTGPYSTAPARLRSAG